MARQRRGAASDEGLAHVVEVLGKLLNDRVFAEAQP
jgi:hypothetical protein